VQGVSAVKVSAGYDRTCAIAAGGGVECWGIVDSRQRKAPGISAIAIATGRDHICAIVIGGGVKCWGDNHGGQLGIGSYSVENSPGPLDVPGVSAIAIAAGNDHTCVILAGVGHGVKCWGRNYKGQLGIGSTGQQNSPSEVQGVSAIAISAGNEHTCAIVTGGGVKCWGDNHGGQLGINSTDQENSPADVPGVFAVAISAGTKHTCMISVGLGGGVKCWGNNYYAQLGIGITVQQNSPVDVPGAAGVLPSWHNIIYVL